MGGGTNDNDIIYQSKSDADDGRTDNSSDSLGKLGERNQPNVFFDSEILGETELLTEILQCSLFVVAKSDGVVQTTCDE